MTSKVLHKPDTGTTEDRFAVVATVANETKLWGTTTAAADPESLLRGFVRAFPAVDFSPASGNHLRVMRWVDWKRAEAGEPARGLDVVDAPDAPVDDHRAQVIAGLLELAAFLHDNPEVPVCPRSQSVTYAVDSHDGDAAAIERVRQMATALGLEVDHGRGYWRATRTFGAVVYGCSYVECARMAQYDAAHSYEGAVEPDGSPS